MVFLKPGDGFGDLSIHTILSHAFPCVNYFISRGEWSGWLRSDFKPVYGQHRASLFCLITWACQIKYAFYHKISKNYRKHYEQKNEKVHIIDKFDFLEKQFDPPAVFEHHVPEEQAEQRGQ
jgi:hypothetical protein